MTAILAVVCAVVVLPFVLVVTIVASIYLYRGWELRRWIAIAPALGLELAPPPKIGALRRLLGGAQAPQERPMRGMREGLQVEVGQRAQVTGGGETTDTTYYTYAKVTLKKPLDVGLAIAPVGLFDRAVGAVLGAGDLQVGHPTIDPAYSIAAAEPEMVRALVRTPLVEQALVAFATRTFRPFVRDTELRCERVGKCFDARELASALDGALDLARRLIAARDALGPSSAERAVNEQWRPIAQARGLAVDVEHTRMAGRVEGVHVEVEAQLRDQKRWTVFTVRFDRPLGVGLRLTRTGSLTSLGKIFGMQDIEVGDPSFDAAFVVKGAPVDAVRALLTPEVRALLVELQSQATQLVIEDDHLSAEVEWLVTDPAGLDLGLIGVARAGALLLKVQQAGAGPYRR